MRKSISSKFISFFLSNPKSRLIFKSLLLFFLVFLSVFISGLIAYKLGLTLDMLTSIHNNFNAIALYSFVFRMLLLILIYIYWKPITNLFDSSPPPHYRIYTPLILLTFDVLFISQIPFILFG